MGKAIADSRFVPKTKKNSTTNPIFIINIFATVLPRQRIILVNSGRVIFRTGGPTAETIRRRCIILYYIIHMIFKRDKIIMKINKYVVRVCVCVCVCDWPEYNNNIIIITTFFYSAA